MIGKYLVIGALLAGILAFMLPFFSVEGPKADGTKTTYTLSVMQMMKGAEGLKEVMAEESPEVNAIPEEDMKKIGAVIDGIKGVLLIPFIPTGFFLLITLIGIKRFGRGLGVFSLLIGLVALGGWAILNAAMGVAAEEGTPAQFEIGFTMLLIGALLGTAGGIMGIAKPQPKQA